MLASGSTSSAAHDFHTARFPPGSDAAFVPHAHMVGAPSSAAAELSSIACSPPLTPSQVISAFNLSGKRARVRREPGRPSSGLGSLRAVRGARRPAVRACALGARASRCTRTARARARSQFTARLRAARARPHPPSPPPDDEKEHLLDALDKARAAGQDITLDDATLQLREHSYCRDAIGLLARAQRGAADCLTAEQIARSAHLADDEKEHLAEALEKRELLGAALTADEAHEALEEHREVRRLVLALDGDGDGWLREADVLLPHTRSNGPQPAPALRLSEDERQHMAETIRRSGAQRCPPALTLDEAHSALEEHREVVAIVRAIESGEGWLTAHNIQMADGVSEDEREHLLETLSAIKASGARLSVDCAHKALEEHREVVAIISAVDAGGDGAISQHNLSAAQLPAPVRACLGRALDACAARGAQLSSHDAHRALEACRHEWAEQLDIRNTL